MYKIQLGYKITEIKNIFSNNIIHSMVFYIIKRRLCDIMIL